MTRAVFLLSSFAFVAAGAIDPPVAGVPRDRNGDLRPLLGVPNAWVLGEPIAHGVLQAAFSGRRGLAKTEKRLLVFDEKHVIDTHDAPQGPAAFSFDQDGMPSAVYFTDARELWTWRDGGLHVEKDVAPSEQEEPLTRHEHDFAVKKTGARLAAPNGAVEQLGETWFVVHSDEGPYALRIESGRELVLRLPEASQ